jgi:hypothetical protein
MTIYVRVTYRANDGKRRTVILQDPRDLDLGPLGPVAMGVEVDRQGCIREVDTARFEREGAATTRTCLICRELIIKRTTLVMDRYHAELVTPAQAKANERRMADIHAAAVAARQTQQES